MLLPCIEWKEELMQVTNDHMMGGACSTPKCCSLTLHSSTSTSLGLPNQAEIATTSLGSFFIEHLVFCSMQRSTRCETLTETNWKMGGAQGGMTVGISKSCNRGDGILSDTLRPNGN
jgi:hypothetical protein